MLRGVEGEKHAQITFITILDHTELLQIAQLKKLQLECEINENVDPIYLSSINFRSTFIKLYFFVDKGALIQN